jgi:hypothetical protein
MQNLPAWFKLWAVSAPQGESPHHSCTVSSLVPPAPVALALSFPGEEAPASFPGDDEDEFFALGDCLARASPPTFDLGVPDTAAPAVAAVPSPFAVLVLAPVPGLEAPAFPTGPGFAGDDVPGLVPATSPPFGTAVPTRLPAALPPSFRLLALNVPPAPSLTGLLAAVLATDPCARF